MSNTENETDEYNWTKVLVTIHSQPSSLNADKKRMTKCDDFGNMDVDAFNLKQLFEKKFAKEKDSFEIVYSTNCSFETFIEDHVQVMNKDKDKYGKYDCFLFVFLTFHNMEDGRLHFSHREKEKGLKPLEAVLEEVKMQEVTWGKPKIFLVQADDLSLILSKTFPKESEQFKIRKVKIPQDADRLVIISTIPQDIANWDPASNCPKPKDGNDNNPSFLIQAFKNALEKNDDLLSLTATMNGAVADLIKNSKHKRSSEMPVPLVTSTLTKLLKL